MDKRMVYPPPELTLKEYQRLAMRTARPDENETLRLSITGLGVAGEAGEVADLIKKVVGHGHPLDRDKLIKEAGDVLWYLADLADALGTTLEEIASINIQKLEARYPQGFSHEASINRVV